LRKLFTGSSGKAKRVTNRLSKLTQKGRKFLPKISQRINYRHSEKRSLKICQGIKNRRVAGKETKII